MKKQAFTLVELLAVIVILAIILAITIPGISGVINNATKSALESDAKMIIKQLEYKKLEDSNFDPTAIDETNITNLGLSASNYTDLKVGIVNDKTYIIITGKGKWANLKACGTMKNITVVDASDMETCEDIPASEPTYTYYNQGEGVNIPVLATGMTAIKWNGSSWDTVANPANDTSWYDYANKEWANAKTADGSYWVWIPRYAYQIATNYHTNTAGTINVKFLIDDTNTAIDATTIDTVPAYSGSSQTNYIKHPAFTFGSQELPGIWIAKFEMSGTTSALDSLPGIASLRNVNFADMFVATRNMETNNRYGWSLASGLNADGTFTTNTNNVDTHMMKNIEWGSAAYLAQSIYGKNAAITINSDANYYTGGGIADAYVTNIAQSTTGTIYGIYDMSGGAWDQVMGNLNNTAEGSGLTPGNIADKYIDRYTTYDNTKFGDAVYETSSTSPIYNSWYSNYSLMPDVDLGAPWFARGGNRNGSTHAGVFSIENTNGGTSSAGGFRVTISVGIGL